jgi:hypothetical protein
VPDPARAILDRLTLRWRVLRDRHLIRWERPIPGEPFGYFPLQMQPEATTSLMAPAFLDQVGTAEAIARSLPLGWKLYVKEHPMMLGARPSRYYARLRDTPNIRVIDPSVVSHSLVASAKMVFTMTGTAAWEASVMGTPAITFAPTPFDGSHSVRRMTDSLDRLPQVIRDLLEERTPAAAYSPLDYLVAAQRHSFAGDTIAYTNTPDHLEQADVERIVDALASYLETRRGEPASPPTVRTASSDQSRTA